MTKPQLKIAPSILSANILNLEKDIKAIEEAGADMIHVDIMDGHFVPNITYGPALVKSLRKATKLFLDVHLMIANPQTFIEQFAMAGADNITVHAEVSTPIAQLHELVKSQGKSFGISIKPDNSVDNISEFLDIIDLLLVMTVYPGFGGQKFIESTLDSITRASELKYENGFRFEIEVDGGLNDKTVRKAAAAGANVIVAGDYIFKSTDYKSAIASLRV